MRVKKKQDARSSFGFKKFDKPIQVEIFKVNVLKIM